MHFAGDSYADVDLDCFDSASMMGYRNFRSTFDPLSDFAVQQTAHSSDSETGPDNWASSDSETGPDNWATSDSDMGLSCDSETVSVLNSERRTKHKNRQIYIEKQLGVVETFDNKQTPNRYLSVSIYN